MKIHKKQQKDIQLERIIKWLKRLYSYDVRTEDSVYLQRRILQGKQMLEFLENFDPEERIQRDSIFPLLTQTR